MSANVLCEAVKEQIKDVLGGPKDFRWLAIRPTGEPPSSLVPDIFIAVHEEGWTNIGGGGGYSQGLNNGISEEYNISATVSIKLAAKHTDYWGKELNKTWDQTLEYTVRSIIRAIHLQPAVLMFANRQLQTVSTSPFVEMLRATMVDPKAERGPKWWQTDTTAQSKNTNQIMGYSRTIHFFGGKRIQGLGDNYS